VESIERKRMVALLIEDVTLVKAERIAIHVRFRGGRTQSLEIDKPKPIALIRKTTPEVINKIDKLLTSCTDQEVAKQLNELGLKNWRGDSFTSKKVLVIRNAYHLKSHFERLRERGMLTAQEMATQLDVCPTTIYAWAHDGLLREHRYGNEHRCLYEPIENVTITKGQGGRKAIPPILMNDLTTKQGAV
jgi:excisionase family DNA binding protein